MSDVACEGNDGLLRIHSEDAFCEVCAPPPGSDEAIVAGCICARLDNAHGIGWHGVPGEHVYTLGCPLHAPIHCPDCGDELPGCRCEGGDDV